MRNRQGEQIERDERVPEARKTSEVKMTRGRCTCISMLEFNTRGSCTSGVKLNAINYSCFDSGPLIQSTCIPPVCVHLVLCPIPLLEVEGSAPAPSLEEEGFARPFLLQ